MLRLRHS